MTDEQDKAERLHCDLAPNELPVACAPFTFHIARLIQRERNVARAEVIEFFRKLGFQRAATEAKEKFGVSK